MGDSDSQDASAVLNAFLQRFLDDEDEDAVKSLEAYQAMFPGHEDLIADKYRDLTTAPEADETSAEVTTLSPGDLDLEKIPSERIGPYKLLTALGEGGMGTVYLAEQMEPIRRRVALKRIKLGMDSREVIARFEAERQALAIMSHANIARVYDAGTTPEGQPYFVMEYVQGSPITEYCDKNRLSLRARLELFMQLCEGIQHAHQKGIIHRDIKPSNVLVAEEDAGPVPKIIDFGIAKSLSQPLTDMTAFTQMGQLIGTPSYTSPEQAEVGAHDIDTRADIYSLGVLLYELIVGALPIDPRELVQGGIAALQKRIVELEPPRPSVRLQRLGGDETSIAAASRGTDERTLSREIQGDLDWITMKALEKDRARRYDSASEFGADLRRFMSNEPILARPPSVVYRVRKFVRRRRVPIVIGLILLNAVFGYSFFLSYLEDDRNRDLAREFDTKGKDLWGRFESAKGDLLEQEKALAREASKPGGWAPVWDRAHELDAWSRVLDLEEQVGELYRSSLIAFYDAFETAPRGSPERARVQQSLIERVGPLERQGFLGEETSFGGPFLKRVFRSADRELEYIPQSARKVLLESDPPGADVYAFRYDLVEGRLFPLAFDGERIVGKPFLKIAKIWDPNEHQELGHDNYWEHPPFLVGDRLLSVDGTAVQLMGELAAAADVEVGESVEVRLLREGREMTVLWTPYPGTGKPNVVRGLRWSFGFDVEGYPLEFSDANRVGQAGGGGRAPLELPLTDGSYLFVLRSEGRVDTRYPVRVPLLPVMEGRAHQVRVLTEEEIPPGFVFVPGGHFSLGGDDEVDQHALMALEHRNVPDFFVSKYEVTVAQYLEFLNAFDVDPNADEVERERLRLLRVEGWIEPKGPWVRSVMKEIARRGNSSGTRKSESAIQTIPVHFNNRAPLFDWSEELKRWRRAVPGTGRTPTFRRLDWPVFAVPLVAAAEYAHWKTESLNDRWIYRIPTDVEWEKAARGVDLRAYVWGNYPVWSFCRSARSKIPGCRNLPHAVGSYPFDQSVYGAFDIAGGVSEMTTDIVDPVYYTFSNRGGNWFSNNDYFFRIANRNGVPADDRRGADRGFRLIAVAKPKN